MSPILQICAIRESRIPTALRPHGLEPCASPIPPGWHGTQEEIRTPTFSVLDAVPLPIGLPEHAISIFASCCVQHWLPYTNHIYIPTCTYPACHVSNEISGHEPLSSDDISCKERNISPTLPTVKLCRQPESNWHAHASTAPSTLRVCHSPMTACSQLSHHGNSNSALLLTEQACRRLHLGGIGIPGRIRTCMSRLRRLSPVPIWTGTSSWQRDLNSQSSAYRAAALHCAMPGNCGSYENRTRLSTVTGWRRQPIDQGAIVGAG